jgi:predicted esterase
MKHLFIRPLFVVAMLVGCQGQQASSQELRRGLEDWLAIKSADREPLERLAFSQKPLTKAEVEFSIDLLFQDKQRQLLSDFGNQWESRELSYQGLQMPFFYQTFGEEPAEGRSLFISMHGGGNTRPETNDRQYENQKHLYDEAMGSLEGIYLAPRAPTNTWNLWHEAHIDDFFSRLIQLAVAKEKVNPNRVYLLGYSAGGDGVYQLAPRMADRWAAASMMAGHPNETSPLGLKNTPFALHMGALDAAYDRNKKAEEWKQLLDSLERNAPGTYIHQVVLHEGKGHWMQLEDASALAWMSDFTRNPVPEKVIWKQDDRHHADFYWLGVPEELIQTGGEVIAEYIPSRNEVNILSNYSSRLHIYLNDRMLDLDSPVTIKYQGTTIAKKTFHRSLPVIYQTLSAKGDPHLAFSCVLTVIDNKRLEE